MGGDDVRIVGIDDPEYPAALREVRDPPQRLWVRGRLLSRLPRFIAVVGTRTPTPYGRQVAHDLAGDLTVAGFCVVSGLARGLDGCAHEGALDAGGTTVAVLGTAIDHVHPKFHAQLAERVVASGAMVSELSPGSTTYKSNFPARNRIIAGMSVGVIVVQGRQHSGALQTAMLARDAGRHVFAVPGNVDVDNSAAPHSILRDGATLCACAGDVLDALEGLPRGDAASPPNAERIDALPKPERALLGVMTRTPRTLESICIRSGLTASVVLAALTSLEAAGLVAEAQRGGWVRM